MGLSLLYGVINAKPASSSFLKAAMVSSVGPMVCPTHTR